MTGRGKGGKGAGKGAAKRHRKQAVSSVTLPKASYRRLARKAGVKRIASDVYPSLDSFGRSYLNVILNHVVTFTLHAKRRTVTPGDVVHAAKRMQTKLVGW